MFNPEDEDALGLLSQNHETDKKIDLSALEPNSAIELLEREIALQAAINNNSGKQAKIWFYFPLADGSAPTLFAPVGNKLKQMLKNGVIIRAMPAQQGGWIVRL